MNRQAKVIICIPFQPPMVEAKDWSAVTVFKQQCIVYDENMHSMADLLDNAAKKI